MCVVWPNLASVTQVHWLKLEDKGVTMSEGTLLCNYSDDILNAVYQSRVEGKDKNLIKRIITLYGIEANSSYYQVIKISLLFLTGTLCIY